MSTIDCRAYNIELHSLNCKSVYSGMSAASDIWVHNWIETEHQSWDYNLSVGLTIRNFRLTTRSFFAIWRSIILYAFILQSWLLSSQINSRSSRKIGTDHVNKPKHAEEDRRTSETI